MTFDRVVMAASLGTLPLFTAADIDTDLKYHLMGYKGYGLMGEPSSDTEDIPADGKGRAVHYIDHGHEFQAAYGRSTNVQKVKIWGGHDAAVDGEWTTPYVKPVKKPRNRKTLTLPRICSRAPMGVLQ